MSKVLLGHSGCKFLTIVYSVIFSLLDTEESPPLTICYRVGTAVEHHVLYQYQFANTQNIYMGVIQTETP